MISKENLLTIFEKAEKQQFVKRGKFLAREAGLGETILTIVSGKLETIKRVEVPSVVLRNIEIGSSAETYVVDKEVFLKRYTETGEFHNVDRLTWQVALAKGEIEAFRYIVDETITIMAPWNEEMLVQKGDWIARPLNGKEDDIYRIEKDTFDQTYSLKNVN